jgi:hypothetical protein
MTAYGDRPPYQQNDYIAWIFRAKRQDTRQKRLQQMLHELEIDDFFQAISECFRDRDIDRIMNRVSNDFPHQGMDKKNRAAPEAIGPVQACRLDEDNRSRFSKGGEQSRDSWFCRIEPGSHSRIRGIASSHRGHQAHLGERSVQTAWKPKQIHDGFVSECALEEHTLFSRLYMPASFCLGGKAAGGSGATPSRTGHVNRWAVKEADSSHRPTPDVEWCAKFYPFKYW